MLAFRVLSGAERVGLRQSALSALGFMLERTGARGGIVAISARRKLCWARSTEAMPWAFAYEGGAVTRGA